MIQLANLSLRSKSSTQVCHSPELLESRISGLTEEQLYQLSSLLSDRLAGAAVVSDVLEPVEEVVGIRCLTARERDVLTLIASGYTRPEVAEALGVTRNTAATHIASIYRKLEIGSIAEATMLAVRWGVVG